VASTIRAVSLSLVRLLSSDKNLSEAACPEVDCMGSITTAATGFPEDLWDDRVDFTFSSTADSVLLVGYSRVGQFKEGSLGYPLN
jgi:hypothetical protein